MLIMPGPDSPIRAQGPGHGGRLPCRRGFTLIETAIVIVIFGIVTAVTLPKVSPTVTKLSATRAANVVAQDLEQGFTLAQRQQKPVVLTAVSSTNGYTVTDRASGTVLSRRSFAAGNGLAMDSVTVAPTTTTIFPSGYASSAVTVTLFSRGSTRTITASRTGLVNVQ